MGFHSYFLMGVLRDFVRSMDKSGQIIIIH